LEQVQTANMNPIATALNRFGLGAKGDEALPANARRWLLDQLGRFDPAPPSIRARPTGEEGVRKLVAYRADRRASQAEARERGEGGSITEESRQILRDYTQAARVRYADDVLVRAQVAVASEAPFVERLVHFWANHFTTSMAKLQTIGFVGPHEFEAIRPHVLGNFRELLQAAVLHPAMLVYLDQPQSVGPGSPAVANRGKRQKQPAGLNENLAREILELHTLGSSGGYSQADVTEFARALTGFTFAGLPQVGATEPVSHGTSFAATLHEPGSRTIMGRRYGQQGADQALAILDELARHPATARHVATKLARHFAADEPPPALVARLENAFLASNGDLPTVYRALIDAPEPWELAGTKFRSPWEWTVGSMRALGAADLDARRFQNLLEQLGQRVWGAPSPLGYPDTANDWAAPDALIRRIEVAETLAGTARVGNVIGLAQNLFPDALNDSTATAIARADSPAQGLALLLASPEMMRR
jgi:uncharacterized protein (DUF1800 family)